MNKRECVAAVEALFQDKRTNAKVEQGRREAEVYAKIPGLKELDAKLSRESAAFIRFMAEQSDDDAKFQAFRESSKAMQAQRAKLLFQHGYDKNYTDIRYECDKCQDEGYVGVEMCDCYRRALSDMYLKQSNLSNVFRNQTLDRFRTDIYGEEEARMQMSLGYCHRFVREFGNGLNLLFQGVPGCGKTYLSVAVGYELIRQGKLVLYAPVQDMIRDFEAEKFGKQVQLPTEEYYNADLLIIDDLGAEFNTPFSESVLYQVINSRINSKKSMIISSNCTANDFKGLYHDRISSRLNYNFVNVAFPCVDAREALRN